MNSDTFEMLGNMLSNPQAMENITNMVKGIGSKEKEDVEKEPEMKKTPPASVPDMNFLANILANNENSILAMNKMRKVYDAYSNANDPSINLINALSPYLSSRRMNNANKIINMVKISKAISVFKEE